MQRRPPIINMRPDGTFQASPSPDANMLFATKLALGAMAVAVAGAGLLLAAAIAWVVSLILPVVIIAGGVAYAAWRLRGWQLRRGQAGRSFLRRF